MRRIALLPLGLLLLLAVASSANGAAKRSFFLSPTHNISCELHWKVLAYGHRRTIGGFRCTSRSTGMTCVRTSTHKGFRIATSGVRKV